MKTKKILLILPYLIIILLLFSYVSYVRNNSQNNENHTQNVQGPSERALVAAAEMLSYMRPEDVSKSINDWGNGDRNLAIKNFALYLDSDKAALISAEAQIQKAKTERNTRVPLPNLEHNNTMNKTCTKCRTDYSGNVVCETYKGIVCY